MPYERFRNMSDEDLASIIVYLRSLPPVRNPLPKSAVPFPIKSPDQRVPQPVEAPVTADLSTPEKRGHYDVEVLAVCGECHTSMDDQGNRVPNMEFAGGTALHFGDRKVIFSANLTPAANGIPVLHRGSLHRGDPDRQGALTTARRHDADALLPEHDRSGSEGHLRLPEDAQAGRSLRGQLTATNEMREMRIGARRRGAEQEA